MKHTGSADIWEAEPRVSQLQAKTNVSWIVKAECTTFGYMMSMPTDFSFLIKWYSEYLRALARVRAVAVAALVRHGDRV